MNSRTQISKIVSEDKINEFKWMFNGFGYVVQTLQGAKWIYETTL